MDYIMYEEPHVMRNARFNNVRGDREGQQVQIHNSINTFKDGCADVSTQEEGPSSPKTSVPAVIQRCLTAAVFTVGLLCFLMVTGIIIVSHHYVSIILEKDQMIEKLQDKVNLMMKNHRNDTDVSIILEKGQLIQKLQDKVNLMMRNHINDTETLCPDGWQRFGNSCYFISSEEKPWNESRADCLHRGADLVIINTEEKKEFVRKLSGLSTAWIGLQPVQIQGKWDWKWVNETPVVRRYFKSGSGSMIPDINSTVFIDRNGLWVKSNNTDSRTGICEKQISSEQRDAVTFHSEKPAQHN